MTEFSNLFNISISDLGDVLKQRFGTDPSQPNTREIARNIEKLQKEIRNMNQLKGSIDDPMLKKRASEKINSLRDELENGYKKFADQRLDELAKQQSIWEHTKDIASHVGGAKMLGRIAGFGGGKAFAAITGGIFKDLSDNLSTITELSQETGFYSRNLYEDYLSLVEQAGEFEDTQRNLTSLTADQFEVMTKMRKSFGAVESASLETLNNIASLPRTMNLTIDEGIEFVSVLKDINMESSGVNARILQTIGLMAEANWIAPKQVMEDVKSNTELFATYSGIGMESLLRSTILARRLSTDIGTVGTVLEGLTDVDSLIETQAKLSMFTGQNMNFIGAANAQFFGRTEDATKSLLEQIASVNDAAFNFPFIKKQFAEQLGVSVDKLNELRKASQQLGSEAAMVSMEYDADLSRFNERVMGVGMGGLRNSIHRNLIRPINASLDEFTSKAQWFYDAGEKVTSALGSSVSAFIDGTGLFGAGAIPVLIAGLKLLQPSYALDLHRNTILSKILMATATGKTSWFDKSFTGKKPSNAWGASRGTLLKGAFGAAGLVGTGYGAYQTGKASEEFSVLSALMGAGSGAATGAMLGSAINPGLGTAIGAIGGGILGAGSYYAGTQMATGGIVTKPLQTWVGEGKKKEAVIPLESNKGKEMLALDLSDSSIEKLARKMNEKKVNLGIQLFDDKGKAIDEKFYKFISGTKSALNT